MSIEKTSKKVPQKNPERSKKDAFDILDKRVKIYRTASKVWQMQMWVTEEQKYIRESLHTEDKEIAVKKAEERFIFYRSKIQNDEKIFSVTVEEMRNQFIESIEEKVSLRQISKGRAGNIKTYTKHFQSFVGRTTRIQNIKQDKFREYFNYC